MEVARLFQLVFDACAVRVEAKQRRRFLRNHFIITLHMARRRPWLDALHSVMHGATRSEALTPYSVFYVSEFLQRDCKTRDDRRRSTRGAKTLILPCFLAGPEARRSVRRGARFPLVPLCPQCCSARGIYCTCRVNPASEISNAAALARAGILGNPKLNPWELVGFHFTLWQEGGFP